MRITPFKRSPRLYDRTQGTAGINRNYISELNRYIPNL